LQLAKRYRIDISSFAKQVFAYLNKTIPAAPHSSFTKAKTDRPRG
jgi:hypothetical protein